MVFIILCRASQKLVIVIFVLTRLWSEPDMVMEKIKLTVKLFCSTNCLGWPSNPGQPKGRSRSSLVELLFIELMEISHTWCTLNQYISLMICNCVYKSQEEGYLLVSSFEPVTFRPRSSLICSQTFLTWFGHFHCFTWPSPVQVGSTLRDRFAAVASLLSGTLSRLSQSLYATPGVP